MRTIVNPKTGRMETVEDGPKVTPADVARQRRELRDMLDGNVQFHSEKKDDPACLCYGCKSGCECMVLGGEHDA